MKNHDINQRGLCYTCGNNPCICDVPKRAQSFETCKGCGLPSKWCVCDDVKGATRWSKSTIKKNKTILEGRVRQLLDDSYDVGTSICNIQKILADLLDKRVKITIENMEE
jgi:hypothetical protein